MKKYEHGGNIYSDDTEYDFSANINPLGMPENVRKAVLKSVDMCESYPEPYSERLVSAISEYENFPAENIVCGNGASDLIYRIISVSVIQPISETMHIGLVVLIPHMMRLLSTIYSVPVMVGYSF